MLNNHGLECRSDKGNEGSVMTVKKIAKNKYDKIWIRNDE